MLRIGRLRYPGALTPELRAEPSSVTGMCPAIYPCGGAGSTVLTTSAVDYNIYKGLLLYSLFGLLVLPPSRAALAPTVTNHVNTTYALPCMVICDPVVQTTPEVFQTHSFRTSPSGMTQFNFTLF